MKTSRSALILSCLCLAAAIGWWTKSPANASNNARKWGVDELLGKGGRKKHQLRLHQLAVAGRIYSWEQYSKWGKELFMSGKVDHPPTGMKSVPLSEHYRCIDCHNNQREDLHLTQQDPEIRAWMIANAKQDPTARPLILAPGTTVWGAVNRESFYNDSYAVYHFLLAPDGEEMDPTDLEDATQVCCKYCSVGRFAEPWEINALLTYFWDLEVTLADLSLPTSVENAVLNVLSNPQSADPQEVASMREFVSRQYLKHAKDMYTPVPAEIGEDHVVTYPDGLAYQGDAEIGKRLYAVACDHCHGPDKVCESSGADLVADLEYFHGILSKGTAHDDQPYMPMFPSSRLSRQQIVDIQAYLLSK